MSSSKRSILARILSWLGLVSAVETKRREAAEAKVLAAETPARQAAFLSALLPAHDKPKSRRKRPARMLAARISAVAKLNGPSTRAGKRKPRIAPAMKPIPKKVATKKVVARAKPKANPHRVLLSPKLPAPRKSAEVIAFKPKRPVHLDRAA